MSKIYNSFQQIYIDALKDLKSNGNLVKSIKDTSSVGSYFGKKERDFVELTGYSFTLTNPQNRIIYSKSRKFSLGFAIANFIWLLSGRNDVETIKFYNKHGDAFSKNGIYYEAAFGERIFGKLKLLQFAKDILIKDENTRRALIPIFIPKDLMTLPNDTPCTSSIQIMIRNQKAEFFLHMRSQSVAMVFPYDIFLFTMLHELICRSLNLQIGNFNYYSNSFHYYTDETAIVEQILSEEIIETVQMEDMCKIDNELIQKMVRIERQMRLKIKNKKLIHSDIFDGLPDYWRRYFDVLYFKACQDHQVEAQFGIPEILKNTSLFV
jgi:thymidylate synthase